MKINRKLFKEVTLKGVLYDCTFIDGMWNIREKGGSSICVASSEKDIVPTINRYIEQEGIRIYGELFSQSEIKQMMAENINLRKQNSFLKKELSKLGEAI